MPGCWNKIGAVVSHCQFQHFIDDFYCSFVKLKSFCCHGRMVVMAIMVDADVQKPDGAEERQLV